MRRLDSLNPGDEFVWLSVPFRLLSNVPEPSASDGRPHLRVMYLADDVGPDRVFRVGSEGLMPADEDLDDWRLSF